MKEGRIVVGTQGYDFDFSKGLIGGFAFMSFYEMEIYAYSLVK